MKFTQKYFWLVVLSAIVMGFVWVTPGLLVKPYLSYILIVMMTLSCLKIDPASFLELPKNWWRYLIILGCIFILPTAIIFLFRGLVSKEVFVGIIIAAAVPSAVSVVFISDLLGGESSKALISTTLAHLVSPIITPFLVWLFARQVIEVNFISMLFLIIKLVIIPLILAQIIRRFKFNNKILPHVGSFNTGLLFILIWGIIAPGKELLWNNFNQFLLAILIVTITLIAEIIFSVWFGRNRSEKITWVVVGCYKNFTLASVIAWSMFGPLALVGAVAYGVINNIMIAPLQLWINYKNKK